jgi:asparagine synthase (glutamine-hydrolysing)
VPVGVLLSGGLDSSLLVGLLADHVDDLLTISIDFEDVGAGPEKADEFEYSDLIAEHFKTATTSTLSPTARCWRGCPKPLQP